MKKIPILVSLLIVASLCFTTLSWAGEASFFDEVEGWIIRSYTEGTGPPYTVKIEVRDTSNNLIPIGNLVGLTENPQIISTNASCPDVSLSFDTQNGKTYVFYSTAAGGLQLADFTISSGGPNIVVNPTSWNYGNVNVGSSSDKTFTVSNTGTANLVLNTITVSGTGFSSQGGTCDDGEVLIPSANCTIIVRFTPPAGNPYSGELYITSTDHNVSVPLSGTGVSQGSGIDLIISGLLVPKSADNNVAFNVSVKVKNQGTSSAGAFIVKGWFSTDQIPENGGSPADQLLFTWNVGGLGAGAEVQNTFSVSFSGFPIHASYYVVVKADAANNIPESNEDNNIAVRSVFVSR